MPVAGVAGDADTMSKKIAWRAKRDLIITMGNMMWCWLVFNLKLTWKGRRSTSVFCVTQTNLSSLISRRLWLFTLVRSKPRGSELRAVERYFALINQLRATPNTWLGISPILFRDPSPIKIQHPIKFDNCNRATQIEDAKEFSPVFVSGCNPAIGRKFRSATCHPKLESTT